MLICFEMTLIYLSLNHVIIFILSNMLYDLKMTAACKEYIHYSLNTKWEYIIMVDIDECSEGASGCDQDCHNTQGSYVCSCRQGFILQQDGHTCKGEHKYLFLIIKEIIHFHLYTFCNSCKIDLLHTWCSEKRILGNCSGNSWICFEISYLWGTFFYSCQSSLGRNTFHCWYVVVQLLGTISLRSVWYDSNIHAVKQRIYFCSFQISRHDLEIERGVYHIM